METRVEELPDDKVRLSVDVPSADVQHAVEHAATDLATSLKIPGFRKGKVPMQVLLARVGKDRLYAEAVESHIGGWYRAAVAGSRIRPASTPAYDYELPDSPEAPFSFTATIDVQPKVEVADWSTLEVPELSGEVPSELVDRELDLLRNAVAELAPADGRPAREGDVVVVDLVSESGDTRRDVVLELGSGRLVDEVESGFVGMSAGETKEIGFEAGDDGETQSVTATLKDVKEKVLPPLDDELAKSASEFDTLADLRADIESRLGEQLEAEIENEFRAAAVDALVDASRIAPAEGLVQARANSLLANLLQSLERRGVSVEAYLAVSGQTPEQVQERVTAEATRSLARELALEAAADKLAIEVSDEELREFVAEQVRAEGEESDEEADAIVEQVMGDGRAEQLREDVRLRKALDRIVAEVTRIPADLARAREKLWTPGQEKPEGATKLWTPGEEEKTA
ncbi:MAG TPA: trigger factor [Gaiellaceae bacterium]|nr:trigger factor [Gaiellaceae bacterium]